MRTIFLVAIALTLQAQSVFACSIDALEKIGDQPLDRLPSSLIHEPEKNRSEYGDGAWQVFEGENGTPHSILLTYLGESGQTKVRLSFLSRRDFVIVETEIDYAELIYEENRTGRFKVKPSRRYFFCEGQLQLPPDAPDAAKTVEQADHWRKAVTESIGGLRAAFERIPE